MLNKKMLIAIPTYNRPEIVKYFLDKLANYINNCTNLYLGFYDSSSNDETEKTVRPFLNEKITYKRYNKGFSEEKGYDILLTEGSKYDYIWFSSDRKVLKIDTIIPMIADDINHGIDLILFSNNRINKEKQEISSLFEVGLQFFEIVNLSKTIIGRRAISHMSIHDVYWKYIGSHFALQAALVDFCGCNDFVGVQYKLRDQEIAETGSIPFVHEWGETAVWQWSKSWCDTVEKLPNSYSDIKEQVIHQNHMFSFKKVLARRASGTEFYNRDINKYKTYIKRINKNLFPLYFAKCFPAVILRIPYKTYKRIKNLTA